MKISAILRGIACGGVMAMGVSVASADDTTNASATPSTGTSATAAPGANSFTEGQAKGRIEAAGFTAVMGLKKDDQGVWRGTASKDGQSVPVALDFKGNVASK